MKKIIVKEEHCIGCGLCEVYCTVQHSKSKDIIKAYNRENPRPTSRVKLEVHKPVSFAIQCRHCKDAPCVTACLSGAMQKDDGFLHNTLETSMAKYYACETASRVADSALRILGAYGYSTEYPVERIFRDAKLYQILEGSANIMKMVIGTDALGYRKANRG